MDLDETLFRMKRLVDENHSLSEENTALRVENTRWRLRIQILEGRADEAGKILRGASK